jgi:hypothetical protein
MPFVLLALLLVLATLAVVFAAFFVLRNWL